MSNIDMNIIKEKYSWKDKEYYSMYQKQLYQHRLCVKSACENCGRVTTFKNMKNHMRLPICKNFIKDINKNENINENENKNF